MTQLINPYLVGWRRVIEACKQDQVHYNQHAFAKKVVELSDSAQLTERDVVELAIQIGLKIFPRDTVFPNYLGESRQIITGLPANWTPFLSRSYFSLAYRNPEDLKEFIAIVPPTSTGFLPYIVHHTSEGYVDSNWFNEVIPILKGLAFDSQEHKVSKVFKNQKLTLGQVNTINHFFKADPILKILEVCTKCYEVSLPKKGFGVRYLYNKEIKDLPPNGIIKEIRFSARKSLSAYEGSRRPYVTELVVAPAGIPTKDPENNIEITKKGMEIYTMLNSATGQYEFSTSNKRNEVHIDASCYDFNKTTMRLPVCSCIQ